MRTMIFNNQEYHYQWWTPNIKLVGTALAPLSFDLETEKIRPYRKPVEGEEVDSIPLDPLHVPRPTLAMAYVKDTLVLIHPSKLPQFFDKHRTQHWVGHNFQFDAWVVMKHTSRATQEVIWKIGDNNGLHDTMLLDLLLQLGTGKLRHTAGFGKAEEARLYPTNLGVLAKEYECGELDKGSEYRLRFGELLGLTEEQIDAHPEVTGFFEYALADVIATYEVFKKQRGQALNLMYRTGWSETIKKSYEIRHDAVEKFGVLSESLQTKGSIVLAELSRTPLRIDQEKRKGTEEQARKEYQEALDLLLQTEPELIRRFTSKNRQGEIKRTKTTLLPQFNNKKLIEVLEKEATRLKVPIIKSDGKTKSTSTSAKAWVQYEERSPFIKAWADLEKIAKLLEFLTALNAPVVYSNYKLLMMNGRTSAGAHRNRGKNLVPSVNIQQMPREDPSREDRSIRSLFLPPEGTKWLSVDYGYIELRTLAAVCRARYGWSKLGDAITEHTAGKGVDPHQRTAASIAGLSIEAFLSLDKKTQKTLRQGAKAVNFGYSGGLGTKKMCIYAKTQYGVNMTPAQAKAAKKAWLETYEEMKLYLADPTAEAIKWQTGKKIPALGWVEKKRISDYLRGDKKTRDKFSYDESERIWDFLQMLAYTSKDEATIEDADKKELTDRVRNLMTYRSCTLTGRIRNNVKYTDGANTSFSGLAADGAKLALWNLMRNGFKLLSFVHDAIDVAVDPKKVDSQTKTIKQIMNQSMQSVIGNNIPVASEGEIGDCWSKG